MCIVFAVGTGSEWGVVVMGVMGGSGCRLHVSAFFPLPGRKRGEIVRAHPPPPRSGKKSMPQKKRGKGKRSCDGLFTFLLTRSLHLPLHVKKVLRLGREREESEERGKSKCHLLFSLFFAGAREKKRVVLSRD